MKKHKIIFLLILSILLVSQSSWSQSHLEVEGNGTITDSLVIGVLPPTLPRARLQIIEPGISDRTTVLSLTSQISLRPSIQFNENNVGNLFGMSIEYNGVGDSIAKKLVFNGTNGLPLFSLFNDGNIQASGKISNVTDPVAAQDAATKNYVDQMSEMMLDAGLNGIVKDIDGNVYKTIKIGTQVWMTDDLKTTKYNDGTMIPEVTQNGTWSTWTTPAYCWYGDDSIMNAKIFGALYNFYAVADTNSLNVCPVGWDVPTDAEWTTLTTYLENSGYGFEGTGPDIGKSMAATFRWESHATAGRVGNDQGSNNSSGFAGLPGGFRLFNGAFAALGRNSDWWSSSEENAADAWFRSLDYKLDDVYNDSYNKRGGFSVRCLRD